MTHLLCYTFINLGMTSHPVQTSLFSVGFEVFTAVVMIATQQTTRRHIPEDATLHVYSK
jgi:hypothetical protein